MVYPNTSIDKMEDESCFISRATLSLRMLHSPVMKFPGFIVKVFCCYSWTEGHMTGMSRNLIFKSVIWMLQRNSTWTCNVLACKSSQSQVLIFAFPREWEEGSLRHPFCLIMPGRPTRWLLLMVSVWSVYSAQLLTTMYFKQYMTRAVSKLLILNRRAIEISRLSH